jgi:hypothetical protein
LQNPNKNKPSGASLSRTLIIYSINLVIQIYEGKMAKQKGVTANVAATPLKVLFRISLNNKNNPIIQLLNLRQQKY